MFAGVLALAAAAVVAPAPATSADLMVTRMTALYEEACLGAFPDDAALDRLMAAKGAKPLTPDEVKVTLVDDPGRGWQIKDGDRSALIILELPPYHACSVRWPVGQWPVDLSDYKRAFDRFASTRPGFKPIDDYHGERGGIRIHASGVSRQLRDGSAESLYIFDQQVSDEARRAKGETGTMMRFVHQIKTPD
jgi:hypothetical protein